LAQLENINALLFALRLEKRGCEMVAGKQKRGKRSPELSVSWTFHGNPHASASPESQANAAPPVDVTQVPSPHSVRTVKLTVNGRKHKLQVEPNWPLRDVLRQKLGLTSVKDFCNGYGACGSCTVLMDGKPVLSCMMLAVECDGSAIETVEGIADAGHPLIEAYIMNWTAQCGYCTPGFVVTAKALLDNNLNPSDEEIKEALSGNLCRCGSYPAHIKAVQQAAAKLRGEK
jgi:aerobic-type carbon monoxide dehydrogenase small subunit (CoxS/CutS family)